MRNKISIIVPVYNAEKTLCRCIESVVRQNYNNYELILVNDGSVDGSADICNRYSNEYQQIRYVYKNNGGVSSARNLGLKLARGEYIAFLDSDDYVTDDFFSFINKAISKYDCDLTLFNSRTFGSDDRKTRIISVGEFFEDSIFRISKRVLNAMLTYSYSTVYAKIFKASIIRRNNIWFDEKVSIGEDQTFLFEYTMCINSLNANDCVLYNIDVSSENSLSRKKRDYLPDQLLKVHKKMFDCLDCAEVSEGAFKNYYAAVSWMFYRSAYSCFAELTKYDYTLDKHLCEINKICNTFSEKEIVPKGLKCKIIAFPVNHSCCKLIDCILFLKSKVNS